MPHLVEHKCLFVYCDGRVCQTYNHSGHARALYHRQFSCLHSTPNNLPCERLPKEEGGHDPDSLGNETFGSEGDDPGERLLKGYLPVMCPLCPLRRDKDREGIVWKTALWRIPSDTDDQYHDRMSVILDYDFQGDLDRHYHDAIKDIYDRREYETAMDLSFRVSCFRWTMGALVSNSNSDLVEVAIDVQLIMIIQVAHMREAQGVKKASFRCRVLKSSHDKICGKAGGLLTLNKWVSHALEHSADLDFAQEVDLKMERVCEVGNISVPFKAGRAWEWNVHRVAHYRIHPCQIPSCDAIIDRPDSYGRHVKTCRGPVIRLT